MRPLPSEVAWLIERDSIWVTLTGKERNEGREEGGGGGKEKTLAHTQVDFQSIHGRRIGEI